MILMRKKRIYTVALSLILMLVVSGPVLAEGGASRWVIDQYTKSRLFVGGYDDATKTLKIGWQVSLKEGWKTYWRSPGEAGLPPRWGWGDAENVDRISVKWPTPHRLHIFDMETLIYNQEVILPIDVAVGDASEPVSLDLELEYMICAEICVPQEGTYRLDIGAPQDLKISFFQQAQLQRYQDMVPIKRSASGVVVTVREGAKKHLDIRLPDDFTAVKDIIVEGPDGAMFGRMNSDGVRLFSVPYMARQSLAGADLILTILSQDGPSHEVAVTAQP